MSGAAAAFRLEVRVMKSSWPMLGAMVAAACLVGAAVGRPALSGSLVVSAATVFCVLGFSVHEKNRTYRLYGFVPLRRRDVVAGRYLLAGAMGAAAVAVGLVITWIPLAASGMPRSGTTVALTLTATWFGFCLVVAGTYPALFALDFSKGIFFSPILTLVAVGLGSVTVTSGDPAIAAALDWAFGHPLGGALIGLAVGAAALIASAALATVLYRRKELT